MMLRQPSATTLAFALLLTTALGVTAPAWGHAKLVQVEPADGAVLAKAPAELRLRFNEAVEPAFTTLRLLDAEGKPLPAPVPPAVTVSERTAVLGLPPALASGRYSVHWATVGSDGHRVQGDVRFVVK